jgi:glycosyltransferase involved in cell wall biosynthesis
MRISVLVPTYKRPDDLRRCLDALAVQARAPDELIVIVRDTDAATFSLLEEIGAPQRGVRTVIVSVPGQVQALNAGLAAATTDIIAITDDDAAPHPDWTERIVAHFEARPDLGGVGGRDRMHVGDILQTGQEAVVGKVPRIGRHVGNHHLGFGEPREVDMLKGVNGSYRMQAIKNIGFDTRLRGTGAQVHWEISLGIALRRAGWKLLYDPQIVVDHFLAKRFDEDQRNTFNALALKNMAYNDTLIRVGQLEPIDRLVFMLWAAMIGTRASPGLVQFLRFAPREGLVACKKFATTMQGRLDAWRDIRSQARGTFAQSSRSSG